MIARRSPTLRNKYQTRYWELPRHLMATTQTDIQTYKQGDEETGALYMADILHMCFVCVSLLQHEQQLFARDGINDNIRSISVTLRM